MASDSLSADDSLDGGHGHFFTKKSFHKPVYCHHCTDMLWGLIGQGYQCEVCNFTAHERCLKNVVSACSSIATQLIKNPVAHCWSEPGHFKRKFCNLCRKRIEESVSAYRCEICEYYVHLECHDFVVSDCKECATFNPYKDKAAVKQYHHWREGNLPANSKCLGCKKTCWSSECLAGMRCEWCGVTAHSHCYRQLPEECSFGCLREIMLPPCSLTIPRMHLSQESIYRFQKRPNPVSVSDEFSSSGDSKGGDEHLTDAYDRKSPNDKEKRERDEEVVRIFDGNASLKRKCCRVVTVPKSAPVQVLLEAALRTFHIAEEPNNYYVADMLEKGSSEGEIQTLKDYTEFSGSRSGEPIERELEVSQTVRSQTKVRDGKRPCVFLRYRDPEPEKCFIKIYAGALLNISSRVTAQYKIMCVGKTTTVLDVIAQALKEFGLETADPVKFALVEVLLDKGVTEGELKADEKLLEAVHLSRKESLRQYRMTRYYLKLKCDPHGPYIAMYIGNLPTGLNQRQYEKILNDIGLNRADTKWSSFDVIYYEYGSLVLLYKDPDTATRAHNVLRDAVFDDKQLLVLLLPNIQPQTVPSNVTPLLVLVNVKSGGQQGMDLIRSFRKLLNPHQVFDLMNGGPLPGLYVFRNLPFFKILVSGGDGTVGWALSCLDNVGQDAQCQSPPMAVVPLGTGNDLARVLRWGSGYTGTEEPINLLRDVIEAEEIKLDRWTVIFHPNEKETDDTKISLAHDTNAANTNEDQTSIFVMNNYFGIGIDADLCYDFHMAREENPDKFNSRLRNKGVYIKMGLRKMVNRRSCKDLHKWIKVEADGKLIELPPLEGIIILNILSWGSGANPWGPEKDDQFAKPTHYDGMLEVVGVTGVVHMGQIQSGLRSAIRIAQAGHLRIHLLTDLPVQVDGEPWIQSAGQVVVLRSALKATMLKKTKTKIKRRNTEPSIYFPNDAVQFSGIAPQPDPESGPA